MTVPTTVQTVLITVPMTALTIVCATITPTTPAFTLAAESPARTIS